MVARQVANYGLSLTPLPYSSFAIATLVGQVPFVLNNVYTGSLVHEIADIAKAGSLTSGDGSTDYKKLVFMALGFLSILYISSALVRYFSAQLPGADKVLHAHDDNDNDAPAVSSRSRSRSPARKATTQRRKSGSKSPATGATAASAKRGRSKSPAKQARGKSPARKSPVRKQK